MPRGVIYRGKKYRILWAGETKYGKRVHLCWWTDKKKDFWADAEECELYEDMRRK